MKRTHLMLLLVFSLGLLTFAGIASAQRRGDDDNRRPFRDRDTLFTLIQEATGLSHEEIVQQWQDGATLQEIITENGGDVEAITAQVVDQWQGHLDTFLTQEWEAPFGNRLGGRGGSMRGGFGFGFWGEGEFYDSFVDITGLTPEEIRERFMAGETLSDIFEGLEIDKDTLIADITATIQEQLNAFVEDGTITQAQADERLSRQIDHLTAWLNGEFSPRFGGRGGR